MYSSLRYLETCISTPSSHCHKRRPIALGQRTGADAGSRYCSAVGAAQSTGPYGVRACAPLRALRAPAPSASWMMPGPFMRALPHPVLDAHKEQQPPRPLANAVGLLGCADCAASPAILFAANPAASCEGGPM
jgi:hypothetical protein